MTIAQRNTCPSCGKEPSLMAGINVPNGDKSERYLICWDDRMMAQVGRHIEWTKVGKAKR